MLSLSLVYFLCAFRTCMPQDEDYSGIILFSGGSYWNKWAILTSLELLARLDISIWKLWLYYLYFYWNISTCLSWIVFKMSVKFIEKRGILSEIRFISLALKRVVCYPPFFKIWSIARNSVGTESHVSARSCLFACF